MAVVKTKEKPKQEGGTVRQVRPETGGGKPEREQRENAVVRTFREVRAEMKKVVWPTREETIRLTVVVIIVSFLISVILFAADSVFQFLLLQLQNAVS
jgi:preprotein translocase subunit SecE